jgi:hypothetical protein
MKKLIAISGLASLVFLAGCTGDTSSDTRQVSTPNPPVVSPKASDFQKTMPKNAQDAVSKVAPMGPGAGETGVPPPSGK